MNHVWFLFLTSLTLSWPLTTAAQKKTTPSEARRAPQITGKFLDTDGVRRLTLEYKHDSKIMTFTGAIHSPCMLPTQPNAGDEKPLELSRIPIGTPMTVFYVRHAQKTDPKPLNVILGIRFESINSKDSTLPKGVPIPCFRGAGKTSR